MGLFSKLSDSLSKTRKGFVEKLFDSFTGKEIDDDLYDELEELLIQGDVGVNTAVDLVERLREREKRDKLKYADQLKDEVLADSITLGEMKGYTKEWNINGEDVMLGVAKVTK